MNVIKTDRDLRELGWLTRAEAAKHVGVSTRTISRWKAQKKVEWAWGFVGAQPVPLFAPDSVLAAKYPQPMSA